MIAQTPPDEFSLVTKNITQVAQAENVPNSELEKAFIVYRSAYHYGKLFEFETSEDFGEVFDKLRLVKDKLRYVTNQKLSDAAFEALKKFEEKEFTIDNKTEFIETCSAIAEGLVLAIEKE